MLRKLENPQHTLSLLQKYTRARRFRIHFRFTTRKKDQRDTRRVPCIRTVFIQQFRCKLFALHLVHTFAENQNNPANYRNIKLNRRQMKKHVIASQTDKNFPTSVSVSQALQFPHKLASNAPPASHPESMLSFPRNSILNAQSILATRCFVCLHHTTAVEL